MKWKSVTLDMVCEHILNVLALMEETGVEVRLGSGAAAVREDSFYIEFRCTKCQESYER